MALGEAATLAGIGWLPAGRFLGWLARLPLTENIRIIAAMRSTRGW